jgi:hypothetical protein
MIRQELTKLHCIRWKSAAPVPNSGHGQSDRFPTVRDTYDAYLATLDWNGGLNDCNAMPASASASKVCGPRLSMTIFGSNPANWQAASNDLRNT